MNIDYLIIGQGLAGSLLAWELTQRQKKIIVVDTGKENASRVAAGLINPVTGMRFVKSTDVDNLLPTALTYYEKLSDFFRQSFYAETPLLRIFRTQKELIACQKRLLQTDYQAYLSEIIPSYPKINSPFGLLKQQQTGYLLTDLLLSRLKTYFISINAYLQSDCRYNDIKLTPSLQWQHLKPKRIIFCEGHHAIHNPWFSWLPFQLVKGEILTARSSKKIMSNILNFGHWYIPLDCYQFRTGATFDRDNLNTKTTLSARNTLLSSLKEVYPGLIPESNIQQKSGIRPTTLDKHPFIGTHPCHPELVFFNGFGAKGSLQIPWSCQILAEHLLNNHPIPSTSNILRYYD